jgi:hypothetical protein
MRDPTPGDRFNPLVGKMRLSAGFVDARDR